MKIIKTLQDAAKNGTFREGLLQVLKQPGTNLQINIPKGKEKTFLLSINRKKIDLQLLFPKEKVNTFQKEMTFWDKYQKSTSISFKNGNWEIEQIEEKPSKKLLKIKELSILEGKINNLFPKKEEKLTPAKNENEVSKVVESQKNTVKKDDQSEAGKEQHIAEGKTFSIPQQQSENTKTPSFKRIVNISDLDPKQGDFFLKYHHRKQLATTGKTEEIFSKDLKKKGVFHLTEELDGKRMFKLKFEETGKIKIKHIPEKFGEHQITEKELKKLKQGQSVHVQTLINGQRISVMLSYNKDSQKLDVLPTSFKEYSIPDNIMGVALSEDQKQNLQNGKATSIEGMRSKKGHIIDGTIRFSEEKGFEFLKWERKSTLQKTLLKINDVRRKISMRSQNITVDINPQKQSSITC